MANEIRRSLLETNGGSVASVMSALLRAQLYDPTDLRATCPYVPFAGPGSDTMDVTLNAVPGAASAATSEIDGSNVTNAAYTTARFQLAVARYKRVYQSTDLLGLAGGPIDYNVIRSTLVTGVSLTYTDMICALFPSLSAQTGTTTVNLDVDDIYDSIYTLLVANVPNDAANPIQCVLHPQQWNDFTSSLRGETGAVQYVAATADMLQAKGPGFKGVWNGVQFWTSDSVNAQTTNVDYSGAMFGMGAFEWTYGPVAGILPMINPGDILFSTPELFVERDRSASNGMMAQVLNLYPAVAIRENARGVEILSDY